MWTVVGVSVSVAVLVVGADLLAPRLLALLTTAVPQVTLDVFTFRLVLFGSLLAAGVAAVVLLRPRRPA